MKEDLIAFDRWLYKVITRGQGYPDETLSGAAWRTEQEGRLFGAIFRPIIDLLALPWQRDHCRIVAEAEAAARRQTVSQGLAAL
jgi:hypothetical protein